MKQEVIDYINIEEKQRFDELTGTPYTLYVVTNKETGRSIKVTRDKDIIEPLVLKLIIQEEQQTFNAKMRNNFRPEYVEEIGNDEENVFDFTGPFIKVETHRQLDYVNVHYKAHEDCELEVGSEVCYLMVENTGMYEEGCTCYLVTKEWYLTHLQRRIKKLQDNYGIIKGFE